MSLSKAAEPLTNLLVSERVLNVFIHGISGALAGSISTLSLYPIENVKTRLQALAKHEEKTTTDGGPEPERKKKNKKLDEMIMEVFQKEGVKGFYKGVFPYFLGTLASFGVYFFWYEFFKAFFIGEKFSVPGYTATALCAGWITTTVTNPIWVVHTRVLLEKDRAVGLIETFKNVLKNEGVEGLFKGIGAGYVLVLNPIVQFLVYEFLKKKFEKTQYQTAMVFLAGAISKTIATLVTYPYQTMKTNLQANKSKNMSQAELIKMILKNKGIQGFFNGLSAKLSQTVINSALMLVIYERLQVFVKQLLVFLLTKR